MNSSAEPAKSAEPLSGRGIVYLRCHYMHISRNVEPGDGELLTFSCRSVIKSTARGSTRQARRLEADDTRRRGLAGPTTSPGVEPGPSTDGFPNGQGRLSFGAGTDRGLDNLALTIPLSHPVEVG